MSFLSLWWYFVLFVAASVVPAIAFVAVSDVKVVAVVGNCSAAAVASVDAVIMTAIAVISLLLFSFHFLMENMALKKGMGPVEKK